MIYNENVVNIMNNANAIPVRPVKNIDKSPVGTTFCGITHDPPHCHETSMEIVFCLRGTATIMSVEQTVILNGGDVFTIDAGDIHSIFSLKDNFLIILHIDILKLNYPYDEICTVFFTCRSDSCNPDQKRELFKIKDCILAIAYMQASGIENAKVYSLLANRIVSNMLQNFDWFDYMTDYHNPNKVSRERFNRISAFCQNNFTKKITLKEIAADEFINENYLSQFFAKSPYGSFSNMLNYIRCYNGEHLLLNTDRSVLEISYDCGFSSPKYFYKHFNKWYGRTPGDHRKLYWRLLQLPINITNTSPRSTLNKLEKYISKYHLVKTLEQD